MQALLGGAVDQTQKLWIHFDSWAADPQKSSAKTQKGGEKKRSTEVTHMARRRWGLTFPFHFKLIGVAWDQMGAGRCAMTWNDSGKSLVMKDSQHALCL